MNSLDPIRRIFYLLVAVLALLTLGIGVISYRYYVNQRSGIEAAVRDELTAVAELKVRQVVAWRKERLADGKILAAAQMIPAVRDVLAGRGGPAPREQVRAWMASMREASGYANMILVNAQGRTCLSVGRNGGAEELYAALMNRVQQTGEVFLSDFHFDQGLKGPHLGLNIPLRATPGGTPLGALLLGIDPNEFLYPLIQSWPTPSRTAETLLVRRDGNEAIYLNELRHRKGTALKLRFPLTDERRLAVKAALGSEGIAAGIDYRDVPAVGALRKVPGSPWVLIAKVDEDEVYAPIRQQLRWLLLVGYSLALAIAMGGVLWRRQLQSRFYQEKYEAELERRALQGRYDYLSRFANDIILLTDEAGRVIEANDRAVTAYGYGRAELVRMPVRDLADAVSLDASEERQKALDKQEGLVFETRHRRKDGSTFPVEVSVRRIAVEGAVFRQSIIRDITERKQAEESLQKVEEQFRQLVENAPVGIFVQTGKHFRYLNPAALSLFGATSVQELLDRPVMERFHPDYRELAAERIRLLNDERQKVPEIEEKFLRMDGAAFHVEVSAVPFLYQDQNGALIFFRDITARKIAEQEQQKSRALLNAIIEGTPDAVYVKDTKGRYLLANGAVCRSVDLPLDEILGRDDAALFPPDVAKEVMDRDRVILANGRMQTVEEPVTFRNGEQATYLTAKGPMLDHNGNVVGLFGIARDITERKRLEEEQSKLREQLQQAQKMESVGRLAGGVAHDFNNLLTVINGYADIVLGQLEESTPLRAQVSEIARAGERAARLTQQLLAFSRKQVIEPKVLDLNDVVKDVGKMLRRLVGEDIAVVTILEPSLGSVLADAGLMHQVLMNLAVNARDAMPNGGKLIIETHNLDIGDEYIVGHGDTKAGRYVELTVTDNGIGMDEETRQKAFEPFFTTKAKGSGTGLGLSTVYGIIKQSGGSIWLYSEPGKGTTFKIYLSRVPEAAEPPKPVAPVTSSLNGIETILVVEDQANVRKLTIDVLKRHGYNVLEAADGGVALLVCERFANPIHLMITDVVMPGMTGRELVDRLAPLRPAMKVLFMSGYPASVIVHQGVLDPGVAYLPKPFAPNALAAKVREMLDHGSPA